MHPRKLTVKLLQRAGLNRLAHKVYYKAFHGFDTANKDLPPALDRCFEIAKDLGTLDEGDYFEFGLFKGYSFWFAQHLATQKGLLSTRFFGFDSFQGLPPSAGEKDEHPNWQPGHMRTELKQFYQICDNHKIDRERYSVVEGFYSDTLSDTSRTFPEDIALAYVDANIEEDDQVALDIAGNHFVGRVTLQAAYDPEGSRMQ